MKIKMSTSQQTNFVNTVAPMSRNPFRNPAVCSRPLSLGKSIMGTSFVGISLQSKLLKLNSYHSFDHYTISMFQKGQEENDEDQETVELQDPETGRTLDVGIEYEFEDEDDNYLMCYPSDEPVILAYEENEEIHPLESDEEAQNLFPMAKRALNEEDILLKNTAYWLTIDDFRDIEEDDDDGEEKDDHELEVFAEFHHEGKDYLVLQPTEPVYMIAKQVGNGYQAILGDELDRLAPLADKAWEMKWGQMEKDGKA